MKPLSLITGTVFAIVLVGCGGKQKKDDTHSQNNNAGKTSRGDQKLAPKVTKKQKATGELREALLHLNRVHFALDRSELLPESRTSLTAAAERLKAYPKVHIYIDGHTDERGTSDYNLALGDRRARVVADYLTKLGIAKDRLHMVTFGEEQPWDSGHSEGAYAKNRRAEFRLMRGDVTLVIDEGSLYSDSGQKIDPSDE